MVLAQKLALKQTQSLVMTPQLQQAIKLLQMSHQDLVAYVREELERNPLLEHGETPGAEGGAEANDYDGVESEAGRNANPETTISQSPADISNALDGGEDNLFPDEVANDQTRQTFGETSLLIGGTSTRSYSEDGFNYEAVASRPPSLREHLSEQLMLTVREPRARLIGQYLIDSVDDDGYMRAEITALADQLATSEANILAVLEQMQGFDPVGVLARNLSECLALQLREKNRLDPAMAQLLEHLDLLARREFSELQSLCDVDAEDLRDMIHEIRQLDPRPGLKFAEHVSESIIPDVIVKPRADGGWAIDLNNETLPRLLVNQSYYTMVVGSARDDQERSYLTDCLQNANWLVKSLDQRARTILKVAGEIIRQQDEFLMYGLEHMRPLTLKTVADKIEMHESTVSRVTNNKYMATPRGIFELKFFFSAAIPSSDGGMPVSAESVRHKIKRLISEETIENVLSDDQLVKILRDEGIDIARRTVAKYRESLHIPSSISRRREKRSPIPS